jgi:hypothetical protein
MHAILLGDSILDNGRYVAGGSPIVEQLRARLHGDWKVTLLARDGAIVSNVIEQLGNLPEDATHLVVSAGGNDALEQTRLVNAPASDGASLLAELVDAQRQFELNYRHLVGGLARRNLCVVACTIYDAVPGLMSAERMALSLFNDVIVRELVAARIAILDLRRVCVEPRDFSSASPIEPSEIGGGKITIALQHILTSHDFSVRRTTVYS